MEINVIRNEVKALSDFRVGEVVCRIRLRVAVTVYWIYYILGTVLYALHVLTQQKVRLDPK